MAKRLQLAESVLLVCDLQEKLRSTIFKFPHVVHTSRQMLHVAQMLDIPVIVTEQYRKGLGRTVSELDISRATCFEKGQFSMLTSDVRSKISDLGRSQVLLVGIEAHVCILQTALDLLEDGKDVFLIADAISSSRALDRSAALMRLHKAGAVITTAESAILEMLKTKDHPKFKELMPLLKLFKFDGDLLSSL